MRVMEQAELPDRPKCGALMMLIRVRAVRALGDQ
jgi:hypothetical protein